MLKNAHQQLMLTSPFKDLDEQEEQVNYDFLEKWVLGKVHPYTFMKSSEVRRKDRKMFKHIACLQFLELRHLDFHFLPGRQDADVLLEDAVGKLLEGTELCLHFFQSFVLFVLSVHTGREQYSRGG